LCSSGVIATIDAKASQKEAYEELQAALSTLQAPLIARGLVPDQNDAFTRENLKKALAGFTIIPKSALLTAALGPERGGRSLSFSSTAAANYSLPGYIDAMRGEERLPELFENTHSAPVLVHAYEDNLRLGLIGNLDFFGEGSFQVLSIPLYNTDTPTDAAVVYRSLCNAV